jgi:hypothetical protein
LFSPFNKSIEKKHPVELKPERLSKIENDPSSVL